jgi:TRAP-type C4-dicarboxylate transport system permease small subunit
MKFLLWIKRGETMIKKAARIMEKIQVTFGVIFLSLFFLVIVIQMFARYTGISLIWTEEAANYSFIWSVFMGASVMIHRQGHFRFTMFFNKLTGKAKSILIIFINTILLIFSIALIYYGIIATKNFWNYNWFSIQSFKMGYMFISIPIMGISMTVYMIDHIYDAYKEMKRCE